MSTDKKRVLVGEGLFVEPTLTSKEPHLIASKCQTCGEVVFPKQDVCPNCCNEMIGELLIGPKGNLYSFTNINFPGPESYGYRGPVPYGVGLIELPEGVRVIAPLSEHDPEKLSRGMSMKLVIELLFNDDEGNEVIGFRFKPMT